MKRREYLTGVAGVGALTAVGATGQVAATSNHTIGTITDPSGDDYGPGTYTYPESDEFKDGVYDMQDVTITDDGDAWTFTVGIAGPVENPYDFDGNFSVQVFQLYVHDPDAPADAPMSTEGRSGVVSSFAEPYHYRVHVVGNKQFVEDASSPDPSEVNVIQDGLNVSGNPADQTISFSVPKDAIGGGNIEDKEVALLLFGQDGFGTADLRTSFLPESDTYAFGGVEGEVLNAPRVIDMLDPEGVLDQQEALSYDDQNKPTIPLFRLGDALEGGSDGGSDDGGSDDSDDSGGSGGDFSLPATASDPSLDDYGPGTYTYPESDEFKPGVYDMQDVELTDEGDALNFTVNIGGPIENPYGFDGNFSVQVFQLYLQDPDAPSDAPMSTEGRSGVVSSFAEPYHYRVHVVGNKQFVEDASSPDPSEVNVIQDGLNVSGNPADQTISFSVPKDAIGGAENFGDYKMALLLFGQDGFGTADLRTSFLPESDTYAFGGVEGEVLNAPRVIDMLDPEGVLDQQEALSYDDQNKPTIPLASVSDLFESGGGGTEGPPDADGDGVPDSDDYAPDNRNIQDPPSETVPGGDGPPQSVVDDGNGYAEDVDGDGDADIDDVRALLNNRNSDAVQNNTSYFDYNDDGRVSISDVVELYNRIFR